MSSQLLYRCGWQLQAWSRRVDEPAFSGLAAEDGGVLVGGELDARDDPLHRVENASRLDMGSRGIDRPAAGYRNDTEQANHQAGGHDADTTGKRGFHRRHHHTITPNSMTLSGSSTSTNKKVTCICRCVSRISGRL